MQFITLVAPYFVVFFFVLLSIVNANIRGFMYLFGVLIVYGIIILFKNTIPGNLSNPQICTVLENYHGKHPSFISGLYAYTIVYILLPMIMNNTFNLPLILLLCFITIVDYIIRSYMMKCMDYRHIILGFAIGGFIGFIWTYLLKQSGQSNLLFYDDLLTSRETCSRPTDEQFKCDVYKNGELIGQTSAPPVTTTTASVVPSSI